jgi:hypothetical protein
LVSFTKRRAGIEGTTKVLRIIARFKEVTEIGECPFI